MNKSHFISAKKKEIRLVAKHPSKIVAFVQSCQSLCDPMKSQRLACLSPFHRAWWNSCTLSRWCHPTPSSSSNSISMVHNFKKINDLKLLKYQSFISMLSKEITWVDIVFKRLGGQVTCEGEFRITGRRQATRGK